MGGISGEAERGALSVDIFRKIAERKIQEAVENGDFDNLSNRGKPLNLDDDRFVPEDLRAAYRVLKNAGCIPHELEIRKEIMNLRDLIDTLDDEKERLKKIRELNFKIIQFNAMRKRPLYLETLPEYEQRVFDKFMGE